MKKDVAKSLMTVDNSAIFEEVFKTHFKNLHHYAQTIVKDENIAEEMVQNVFYKLWEKKEQLHVESSLAAYLYRAVHNESMSFIKHTKVKADYRVHALSVNREFENFADPAAIKELQQKIDIALIELPEQCRTIFQLSRFEELNYRMIADKLGISVKTVENQMGKALKILRLKLVEYIPVLLMLFINLEKLIP